MEETFAMDEAWIRLAGPNRAVEILGVRLVGVNAENAKKLLFTIILILLALLLGWMLRRFAEYAFGRRRKLRTAFWIRQAAGLMTVALILLGLASIWFDDPTRLATAFGLITAGLAFAMQKFVTAVIGYFVILRGRTFHVGDRIVMGGVRGDVVALGLTQTTIMEMGQPPPVQAADPAMWVKSRQYTGRIVTVSNSKIFDEPVYNYTRDFPYIWEEMAVPIPYTADRGKAEEILLSAAGRHTVSVAQLGEEALLEMQRRFYIRPPEMGPKVYYRLTDNWLELTVRFIVEERGMREVKDSMGREILAAFDKVGIGIASATFEVVGLPPVRLEGGAPVGRTPS